MLLGFEYRTKRVNEVVKLEFELDKGFSESKTEQNEENFNLAGLVNLVGFEPMTFPT